MVRVLPDDRDAGAGGYVHVLVGRKLRSFNCSRQSQARQELDAEAYKEREIPIPAKLSKKPKAWKAKSDKTCSLVFPTAGGNPKLNFLDDLKAVSERAKLDEDNFWTHKFRATFATRCLWAGVDLRTVQQWLGHSDMESTMRYLKPSRANRCERK